MLILLFYVVGLVWNWENKNGLFHRTKKIYEESTIAKQRHTHTHTHIERERMFNQLRREEGSQVSITVRVNHN